MDERGQKKMLNIQVFLEIQETILNLETRFWTVNIWQFLPPTDKRRKQPAFLARALSRGDKPEEEEAEEDESDARVARTSEAAAAAQWSANHR